MNIVPRPTRSYLPKIFSYIFWAAIILSFLVCALLSRQDIGILCVAYGLDIYILLDMFASIKNDPPKKRMRKFQAVATTLVAAVILLVLISITVWVYG